MQDIESKNRKVIGVNHAIMEEEKNVEGEDIDPKIAEMQNEKLARLHNMRDPVSVTNALKAITEAATTDVNLFPLILHAVKVYCSVGEIMNAMKLVFGTWSAPSGF